MFGACEGGSNKNYFKDVYNVFDGVSTSKFCKGIRKYLFVEFEICSMLLGPNCVRVPTFSFYLVRDPYMF